MTPDLTVMGAGIFGLSIAWEAARRGARVAVIDPGGPGAGASGGVVGALSPHVPEAWNPMKQFQFDALMMAEGFWAGVAAAAGRDPGYARSGRLQPLADPAAVDLARRRAAAAASLWQGRAEWAVIPVQADGWCPAAPSGFVVRDTLSARIAPRAALAALAAAVAARGGTVAAEGPVRAPVVWATGAAGLAELSAALGRDIGRAEKGQAALLRHAAPERPQIFTEGLYIVPHADGTVAIGSTSERDFADPAATDAALDALIARARALCPALAGAPVAERWAGLRPRAATRRPLLGPWPGRPGHFVANGGFRTGFGLAPAVAALMADLVLAGRDAIPDAFRP